MRGSTSWIWIGLAVLAGCSSPSADDDDDDVDARIDASAVDAAIDGFEIDARPTATCAIDLDLRYAPVGTPMFWRNFVDTGTGWLVGYVTQANEMWTISFSYAGAFTAGPTQVGTLTSVGSQGDLAFGGGRGMVLFNNTLQRLTATGAVDGAALTLTPPTPGMQTAGIAAGPGSEFRVVWGGSIMPQPGGRTLRELAVARYDADGAEVGTPTRATVESYFLQGVERTPDDGIFITVSRQRPTGGGNPLGSVASYVEVDAAGVITDRGELPLVSPAQSGGATLVVAGSRRYIAYGQGAIDVQRTTEIVRTDAPQTTIASFVGSWTGAMAGTGEGTGAIVMQSPALHRFTDDGTTLALGAHCFLASDPYKLLARGADRVAAISHDGSLVVATVP